MKSLCAAIVALVLSAASAAAQDLGLRDTIELTPAEHSYMLGEMQRNMTALQRFFAAQAAGHVAAAREAALSRGTAAFAVGDPNRPPELSAKLTPLWRALAGEGRKAFDALAQEPGAERLAALMANCNACHAAIRLTTR